MHRTGRRYNDTTEEAQLRTSDVLQDMRNEQLRHETLKSHLLLKVGSHSLDIVPFQIPHMISNT